MPGKNTSNKNKTSYDSLADKGLNKQKPARITTDNEAGKKSSFEKRYEDRTRTDLYGEAKKVGIEGRSKMNKYELIDALRNN